MEGRAVPYVWKKEDIEHFFWECASTLDLQCIAVSNMRRILGEDWMKSNSETRTKVFLCFTDGMNITREQLIRISDVTKGFLNRAFKRRENYVSARDS